MSKRGANKQVHWAVVPGFGEELVMKRKEAEQGEPPVYPVPPTPTQTEEVIVPTEGEITVIETQGRTYLQREEKELFYAELARKLHFSYEEMTAFIDLEELAAAQEIALQETNIAPLVLKKICDSPAVVLILKEQPARLRTMDDVRAYFHIPKKGGASEIRSKGEHEGGAREKQQWSEERLEDAELIGEEKLEDLPPSGLRPWSTPAIYGGLSKKLHKAHQLSLAKVAPVLAFKEAVLLQLDKEQAVITQDQLADFFAGKKKVARVAPQENMQVVGVVVVTARLWTNEYLLSPLLELWLAGDVGVEFLYQRMFLPYSFTHQLIANTRDLKWLGAADVLERAGPGTYYLQFRSERQLFDCLQVLLQFLLFTQLLLPRSYYRYWLGLVDRRVEEDVNAAVDTADRLKFTPLFNALREKREYFLGGGSVVESVVPAAAEEKVKSRINKTLKAFLALLEKYYAGKFYQGECPSCVGGVWIELITQRTAQYAEKAYLIANKNVTEPQRKKYEQELEEMVVARKREIATNVAGRALQARYIAEYTKEALYRYLFIDKFGLPAYEQLVTRIPSSDKVLFSYHVPPLAEFLSPKQRELVEIEMGKRERELKERAFSAPWVEIVRKLRRTDSIKLKMQLYEQLKPYLVAGKDKNDWLRDANGHPILCPHVRDRLEMEAKNKSDAEIHEYLMRYAGDVPIDDAFYCKICGERLTYNEDMEGFTSFEEDRQIHLRDSGGELRDFLWKQINQTVRGNIQFTTIRSNRDTNTFISNLVEAIYGFVNQIEKRLVKSKTSSPDDIANKRRLFAMVYVYAVLVKVIVENPSKVNFVRGPKLGGVAAEDTAKLLKFALDRLVSTQNTVINKIPDMTEDYLESALHKALQNLVAEYSASTIRESEKLDSGMKWDLTFSYLSAVYFLANRLATSERGGEMTSEELSKLAKGFGWKDVYKRDPDSAEATDSIFKHLIPLPPHKREIERFHELLSIKGFALNKLREVSKAGEAGGRPIVGAWLGPFFAGYFYEGFRVFVDYLQSAVYMAAPYTVQVLKRPYKDSYIITTQVSKELADYEVERSHFRSCEHHYQYWRQAFYARNSAIIPFHHSMRYAVGARELALNYIYGYSLNREFPAEIKKAKLPKALEADTFHVHKWDLLVYYDGTKSASLDDKQRESIAAVGAIVNEKNYKDYVFFVRGVDKELVKNEHYAQLVLASRYCVLCLHPYAGILNNIKDVESVVEREIAIATFYNYYDSLCPAAHGDTLYHVFGEDGVCKNCGVTKKMIAAHDLGYYKKYLDNFVKATRGEGPEPPTLAAVPIALDIKKETRTLERVEKLPKWQFNARVVNEFVDATYDTTKGSQIKDSPLRPLHLKKPEYINFWLNVGFMEGSDFEEVIRGHLSLYKDIKNVDLWAMREHHLDSYINELIDNYYILANHRNMAVLPLEIKHMLEHLKEHDLVEITKMQDIELTINFMGAPVRYEAFKKEVALLTRGDTTHENSSNFYLEFLLVALLNVFAYQKKLVGKELANEFLLLMLTAIFRTERLTSKIKEQKAVQVEANVKLNAHDDPNMQDHRVDDTFDELKTDEMSKYSTEGLDYDGSNDESSLGM